MGMLLCQTMPTQLGRVHIANAGSGMGSRVSLRLWRASLLPSGCPPGNCPPVFGRLSYTGRVGDVGSPALRNTNEQPQPRLAALCWASSDPQGRAKTRAVGTRLWMVPGTQN